MVITPHTVRHGLDLDSWIGRPLLLQLLAARACNSAAETWMTQMLGSAHILAAAPAFEAPVSPQPGEGFSTNSK